MLAAQLPSRLIGHSHLTRSPNPRTFHFRHRAASVSSASLLNGLAAELKLKLI
jgi:hypothetical protein